MERLETARLILRGWSPEDAANLYEYAKSPNVGPMAGWKPHESEEESMEVLASFIGDGDVWALESRETGRVIGSIGLHKRSRGALSFDYELGYALAEEHWGQGLMVEAADAVIAHAFGKLGANVLIAAHFPFNDRSRRVIEKLGFRYLRQSDRSFRRWDGQLVDELVYMLTHEAYIRAKNEI